MLRLIISEKPSVAISLAKAMGVKNCKDGYFESEQYLVSWCGKHLIELASADMYDARYSKWEFSDLPIFPKQWKYAVSPHNQKQFEVLRKLLHRSDVATVINACDAGIEGELIFHLVYEQSCCNKPVQRLWISSMEDEAIRKGFDNLLDGKSYESLYQAALCRSKADWLVGINATRLFSCLHHKTLNIGRVMTPTLALLTQRENTISTFQKKKFYVVLLKCGDISAESNRFPSKTQAQEIRTSCLGKVVTIQSVKQQEYQEKTPKLFDLTTLQREANQLYGYTAQQTLDYVQALYEKKLVTYPLTDSNYVTDNMEGTIVTLVQALTTTLPFMEQIPISIHSKVVIDNSKVSTHHAILPTLFSVKEDWSALPTGERNILLLLCVRLFCAVHIPFVWEETEVTLRCMEIDFYTRGRMIKEDGWKSIWKVYLSTLKKRGEEKQEKSFHMLPPLQEGETLFNIQAEIQEEITVPPKRYTEATLLQAMENVGTEHFSTIKKLEHQGLGIPATRAGVIEKLVRSGLIERNGQQMVPTTKGMDLISILPDVIKSAKLTADWEVDLKGIERNNYSSECFLNNVQKMLIELVQSYQKTQMVGALFSVEVGKCPRCGRSVYEGKKGFYCSGYQDNPPCTFSLWKNNRFFVEKQKVLDRNLVVDFLKTGRVKMTKLYSEKKGMYYDAMVVMQDTGGKFVQFKLEFPKKR